MTHSHKPIGTRHQLYFVIYAFVLLAEVKQLTAIKCDRTPEGYTTNKSPADGRFILQIGGNPERYVPGEPYNGELFRFNCFMNFLVLINN